MLSISLGPIALPVPPVLLFFAAAGSAWLASRLAAREQAGAAIDSVSSATLLGLLGARLGYLAMHADLYLASPWSAFDLRDGGWHAASGAVVGGAWLLWRAWRSPSLRRPLAAAALAGPLAWSIATAGLRMFDNAEMPTLELQTLEAQAPSSLRQAAGGRPVVVNLWASWCGPCRYEMPVLAAAQQREAGIGFLFVNQGESAAAVRAYLVDQDLSLREVLLDRASRLGPAVGSQGLPTTLFYDADGRLQGAHLGILNAAALESRLRRLRQRN